jgi:hypothetical protein
MRDICRGNAGDNGGVIASANHLEYPKPAYIPREICDENVALQSGANRCRYIMTSEQCMGHAAHCLRLAQNAASPEQKRILLDLARGWELTAKQMERLETREANEGTKRSARRQPTPGPAGCPPVRGGGVVEGWKADIATQPS